MAFNGRFVLNMAHLATNYGVDSDELILISKKSSEELCDESCIVENVVYNAVIEKAVELTKDPFFGLHAGENLNLAAAGLISQITQSCETVKQALEYCCAFANLGCSALPMKLEEQKDQYKLTLKPNKLWEKQSPIALKHTAEGVLAFTIKEFHSLTRQKHSPIAIHLPWKGSADIKEYERIYACPVFFNKNEIALLLRKQDVEEKVISSDYTLLRILVAHAEEKSAQLVQQKGFSSIVKQSVVKLVKPEFPTIEMVASHLNISLRTMQRRLKEEGITYKEILDDLRKEFAITYLKRDDLSISDIAYLLSYSEISAFTRSFKRWTDESPKEYRIKRKLNL